MYVFGPGIAHADNADLPQLPHAFADEWYSLEAQPYRNLVERSVDDFIHAVLHKDGWETKIKNANIRKKWRREAAYEIVQSVLIDRGMQELEYLAAQIEGDIRPSPVHWVWQADDLIGTDLYDELQAGLLPLEEVSEELKDWHPGSNNQVLDLIHPSLYCLLLGKSPQVKQPTVSIVSSILIIIRSFARA